MDIDVGNAQGTVASPGVGEAALDRLDDRVAQAHRTITTRMSEGRHGYQALAQPSAVDLDAIRRAVAELPDPEAVLLIGIGGSALGAATVATALPSTVDLYVLDNIDPTEVESVLNAVQLDRAVVHVVSRSGQTTETLANFAVVRAAMERAGVEWAARTLVTTGPEGRLRELATAHNLPTLDAPPGVPGRYAVLSTVALPALALRGHDLEALIAGGQAAVDRLDPSLFDSPAYAYGAITAGLAARGVTVNAMMPYAEALETFSEWFAQLWAESLGKDGLGQVPVRTLGATDQHSQLQLYRAGPRQVLVTFLRVREGADLAVPDAEPATGGETLRSILDTELRATEASLAAAGRPNVRLEIDRVDEHNLGDVLVSMQAACILAGELLGVDPFDQPAVEWGKRAIQQTLAGEEGAEANAMRDKQTRWIRG